MLEGGGARRAQVRVPLVAFPSVKETMLSFIFMRESLFSSVFCKNPRGKERPGSAEPRRWVTQCSPVCFAFGVLPVAFQVPELVFSGLYLTVA